MVLVHSPQSTPRGKQWQGRVKTWNRDALRKVAAQLAADTSIAEANAEVDAELDLRSQTDQKPRDISQIRKPPRGNNVRETSPTYKHESKIRLRQLRELRDGDQRMISQKCARDQRQRELKFERMADEMKIEDQQRVYAGHLLADHEQGVQDQNKKHYDDWNRDIHGRVQYQLFRSLNPNLAWKDDLKREASGESSYNFVAADDPLKRQLREDAEEKSFRRTADSIVYGLTAADDSLYAKLHEKDDGPASLDDLNELWNTRETTKTMLQPDNWGQLKYSSTTEGLFASSRQNERGSFFTQRRMGLNRHVPTGSDGILSGGTLKSRLGLQNDLGILTGEWGKRGQTSLYKEPHGPSSGAPGQDHFGFETGLGVSDQEFPLGKKMFRNMH